MGSIIKGVCQSCHYESEDLYYGGGMMNFTTCCNFPVLDNVGKIIKTENILEKEKLNKLNPNRVFYDDKSLSDKKLQNRKAFHEWGEFKLYYDGYLCPKCNKFSLGFKETGCWD